MSFVSVLLIPDLKDSENLENIKNIAINSQTSLVKGNSPAKMFKDLIENKESNLMPVELAYKTNSESQNASEGEINTASVKNQVNNVNSSNNLCNGHSDALNENCDLVQCSKDTNAPQTPTKLTDDPESHSNLISASSTSEDGNPEGNADVITSSSMSNMNNQNSMMRSSESLEEAADNQSQGSTVAMGEQTTPRSISGDSRMDQDDKNSDRSLRSMTTESR